MKSLIALLVLLTASTCLSAEGYYQYQNGTWRWVLPSSRNWVAPPAPPAPSEPRAPEPPITSQKIYVPVYRSYSNQQHPEIPSITPLHPDYFKHDMDAKDRYIKVQTMYLEEVTRRLKMLNDEIQEQNDRRKEYEKTIPSA